MSTIFKSFILPPNGLIILLIVSLILLMYKKRLGMYLVWGSALGIFLLSTPFMAKGMMKVLERHQPLAVKDLPTLEAQAIVILASGREHAAVEYNYIDNVNTRSLVRLRYGAFIHKRTGLPILVSGGGSYQDQLSEAQLIDNTLKSEFNTESQWLEHRSKNTYENAIYSRKILEKENIRKIFLVTHAWHMLRAADAFEKAGFEVVSAPTKFEGYIGRNLMRFGDFFPSAIAFKKSYYAIHELIAIVWYKIKY